MYTDYDYTAIMTAVQDYTASEALTGVQEQQDYYYEDEDVKIGSVLMEGGAAGADIWAYDDGDGAMMLEFQGWRSDGSHWSIVCSADERIDKTLKTACLVGEDLGALVQHIRVTSINYSKDMPDCTITRDATTNQRMDFPDQRWVDVRDQDQWYNVHMVVRHM
jgi:hypothetical protein